MPNCVHMTCHPDTKKKIMEDCVAAFLEDNPSFDKEEITQGFMLKRMAHYYLSRGKAYD